MAPVRNIGPEPFGNFSTQGVRTFSTDAATVKQAVQRYLAGDAVRLTAPSVPLHHGFNKR